jgi:hypothetical protein
MAGAANVARPRPNAVRRGIFVMVFSLEFLKTKEFLSVRVKVFLLLFLQKKKNPCLGFS